jgi:integrase
MFPGGSGEQSETNVKFPKRLRYRGRGKTLATIYKGDNPTQPYNVYWRVRVDGKPRSRFKSFASFTEAKRFADKIVNDIGKGVLASTLSPGQAADALNALEELQRFYQATGNRLSIRFTVGAYCEAARKLQGRPLAEAVDGYLRSVVSVKRVDLAEAVQEFVAVNKPRTVAPTGQRPEIGSGYARQKGKMLQKFAAMFPGHAVCDLTKGHLDKFMNALPTMPRRPAVSPKSRNHHRAAVKQFLNWATRKDYLPIGHRLFEADTMRMETTNGGATEFYTPRELRDMLETADGAMQPLIAIGGMAGLRVAELLRLDWADVWHVKGHIEVTAGKAKTRQRRLVGICPALAAWLRPFRTMTTGKLWNTTESKFQKRFDAISEQAGLTRKRNGLRHSFCTYHFALHANENLTAQQAGNSPGMVHEHYKGLATRKEAAKFFAIRPAKSASNIIELQNRTAL